MTEIDRETLKNLVIKRPSENAYNGAKEIFDKIAKPLDGLGLFEEAVARIVAIKENAEVSIDKRALIIMSSDNGIVDEGVSQSGKEVTLKVIKNILRGKSSSAVMAKEISTDYFVYDVGIDSEEKIPGLIDKKIRRSSRNFLLESAMTEEEMFDAILIGINATRELYEKGYELIAIGEMGIGNTTTSSAICASLLHLDGKRVAGRGAGLSDDGLDTKIKVIDEAIHKYDLYNADALTILKSVGGYDIAALAGVCIGGALYGIPIILDGVITQAAALIAREIHPNVKEYLFASHKGKEKASTLILEKLGLKGVIDANMALGEGTGALMYISLLSMALSVYKKAARFDELEMSEYKRIN